MIEQRTGAKNKSQGYQDSGRGLRPQSLLSLTWDVHFRSWSVASPSGRLHNMAATASQTMHAHCRYIYIYTETNPIVFIAHNIAPRHMIGSEITSNRCDNIWLCNRSLDGDTLQLQNPSDVAQSLLALTVDQWKLSMNDD